MGLVEAGDKTVVVGAGSVGIESAIQLKEHGKDVCIIEIAPDTAKLTEAVRGVAREYIARLEALGIPLYFNCKLSEVTDTAVLCQDTVTGEIWEFAADTVLLALGMRPRHQLADTLRRSAPETEVYVVGDALYADNIASAIRTGFKAAAYI